MRGKKFISLTLSTMLCLQLLPTASFAAAPATDTGNAGLIAEGDYAIAGNGVRVTYDADGQTITLYRTEGSGLIQMSKPSPLGGPVVGGQEVQDFSHISCDVEQSTSGVMGSGQRMTITSQSMSTGLIRTYVLETSDIEEGVVYTATSYEAGASDVEVSWFIGSVYELYGAEDRIWSYNGGGEGPMHYYDTLQKIDLTDSGKFSRENKQDDTAASIPVSDIYIADGGITVGDASATRREVHTPVQETSDSAQVSIGWPGKVIAAGSVIEIGESFAVVHPGDYYNGLRGYKNAMDHLGVIMPAPGDIPDSSYDLRWESWGWGFNWTIDLIIGKLDELQAAGVKQITLDDGWYTNAGDWALNPEKFPNGASDALRLTDAIHEHGMTALLWWRPCDGGIDSILYTGVWNDDYHDVFQEGTARYASSAGASVEFEFTGSEIRWYGQNDSNFGVASVYIDNEFVQQVNVNGAAAVGKLLFQKTDLPAGSHTIRIVCDTPVIDLDYLTYTTNA